MEEARKGLDVICAKGETAKRFNEHYRDLIRQFYPAYTASGSNALKRMMTEEILSIIQSKGGRFFCGQSGKELGQKQAKKKIQKALKDYKRQDPERNAHKKSKIVGASQAGEDDEAKEMIVEGANLDSLLLANASAPTLRESTVAVPHLDQLCDDGHGPTPSSVESSSSSLALQARLHSALTEWQAMVEFPPDVRTPSLLEVVELLSSEERDWFKHTEEELGTLSKISGI